MGIPTIERLRDGNEIGENITVIKRKSKHGIHVDRTSDQQRNVEKLS